MTSSTADLDGVLAAVPLFAGLSRRHRSTLLKDARVVQHTAGNQVAKEGEGALAMHVLLEGTGKVSVGGEEVRTLSSGDWFGEISLIDGKPRSATVTAGEGLSTLAVSHASFADLVEDDPTVARALLVALCARVRDAESRAR